MLLQMKVTAIWSLVALQTILFNVTVFAGDETSLSRSGYIVTQENMQLRGYVVQRFKSPNLMSCSHLCLKNAWCTSTNFHKTTCELNRHEISTIDDDTKLYERQGVTFSLHLKGCLMNGCLNGGTCLFDETNEKFACSCKLPWTGKKCEVKMELMFNFTSLGSVGKQGPTSNAGYNGSALENIKVSNGLQEWSAPLTGSYHVGMCGASGGESRFSWTEGGKGAKVNGTVHLEEGTKLIVLVGQRGNHHPYWYSGAGGGGTFVVFSTNSTPLSIAGGGGGAGGAPWLYSSDGGPGQAGETEGLMIGIVGKGGRLQCVDANPLAWYGGYGGGFGGDGMCCNNSSCNGTGGESFLQGGRGGSNQDDDDGGCDGSFGGGGASSYYTGGGGGGYSGGSVIIRFNSSMGTYSFTGGGGSFVPDNTWNAETGACDKGDGYVTFRFLGIP